MPSRAVIIYKTVQALTDSMVVTNALMATRYNGTPVNNSQIIHSVSKALKTVYIQMQIHPALFVTKALSYLPMEFARMLSLTLVTLIKFLCLLTLMRQAQF